MGDKSSVKVHFLGDATALAAAARKARGEVAAVGRQVDKSGRGIMGGFKGMGMAAKAGIAGVLTGSLAAGGKAVFDMAANMELMDAKAKTVFGGQIGTVQKWAKANANAMGLTGKEATGLAANFADLLIPMGFSRKEAAKMSTDVVGLSGALSRWSGGTKSAAEVSEILAKAMLGERDGLKELGISISEADVQQRLLKNGKDKLTGAALEQAKAEATSQLIFEKSGDAQAAYAKGSTTLAAKKALLTAKIKELRDKAIAYLIPKLVQMGQWIETHIVPAIKKLVDGFKNGTGSGGKIREMIDRVKKAFEQSKPSIEKIVTVLGRLVAAFLTHVFPIFVKLVTTILPPVLKIVALVAQAFSKMVQVVLTVLGTIINAAAKAFGWVPGLGGKLKTAAKEFNKFRDDVNKSLNGIKDKKVKITAFTAGSVPMSAAGRHDVDVRAKGGPVTGGDPYVVGEEGPELFVPSRSGTIIPNGATVGGGRRGGGGGAPSVSITVNGFIGSEQQLAREITRLLNGYRGTTGRRAGFAT